ncbi:hypothetical protein WMF30_01265 [Sorangium sp. So ce134]
MKPTFLMTTAAMSALAIGCVEGESHMSDLAGEDLGHAQQAIEDEGCGKINMAFLSAADGISRSTIGVQQSPDWTYNPNSNRGQETFCPYQYLVEYTNLPAFSASEDLRIVASLHGNADWSGITNEMDCERTHLQTGYYVWDTSTTTNPTITSSQIDGVWNSSLNSCSGSLSGDTPALDGKYKARITVRALYCAFSDGCTEAQRTNLKVETDPGWVDVIH